MASAINTVSPKRFYAAEKRSSFLDPLAASMQDVSQKTEDLADATASADTTTSASSEGQDEEDPLLQQMVERHERYKRWLAKIMGKDQDTFGEKEIKEAVEYLMPSGLYAKDARPLFEDPKKLYQQRAKVVDKHGRPLRAAFFTGQVGFHDLLFEIYEQTAKLNAGEEPGLDDATGLIDREDLSEGIESSGSELSVSSSDEGYSSDTNSDSSGDERSAGSEITKETERELMEKTERESKSDSSDNDRPDFQDSPYSSDGSKLDEDEAVKETERSESTTPKTQPKMRWIGKQELERKIGERLTDKEYDVILHRLKKLATHPNADLATPFLLRFLEVIPIQGMRAVEKTLNEKGEAFGVGHRKRAVAEVTVKKGSGNVTVNNIPMTEYFKRVEDRKQVMYPFLTVDAVGEYDVDCAVIGGGSSGQVGAIRLAISRALLNFEDSYVEPLQQAGLLIRDPRIKERKKPGQKRARKKFAWVRR